MLGTLDVVFPVSLQSVVNAVVLVAGGLLLLAGGVAIAFVLARRLFERIVSGMEMDSLTPRGEAVARLFGMRVVANNADGMNVWVSGREFRKLDGAFEEVGAGVPAAVRAWRKRRYFEKLHEADAAHSERAARHEFKPNRGEDGRPEHVSEPEWAEHQSQVEAFNRERGL